jgi:hypothetical protein
MRPFFVSMLITVAAFLAVNSFDRETYFPRLLPDIESAVEKVMKNISSLNKILDETITDNTCRVVLDTLFKVPSREKPVFAQIYLLLWMAAYHPSLAQCVVEALGKYQIPLTKGVIVDAL